MEKIKIKSGIYEVELTTEDVKRIYEQNEILKDAALLFLNKEEADKNWDIHMSYEEAKDLTKEILIKSGYNEEFLEKVFKENKMEDVKELNDLKIEELWENFGNVIIDEEENITTEFLDFEKGTNREEIWKWFDKKHSKGVHFLLYERED